MDSARDLASCEVCRIVLYKPNVVSNHRDPVEGFRKLREDEFFGFCPLCKRSQVFKPLPKNSSQMP